MWKEQSGERQELLLVCGPAEFCEQVQKELQRRHNDLRVEVTRDFREARRALETRTPSAILLEERAAEEGCNGARPGRPGFPRMVSALAERAPVVVIGDAEHRAELRALLAAGTADYVVRCASCVPIALSMVERRLRPKLAGLNARNSARSEESGNNDKASSQDFGEVLRHELNNPLTGILGNAELLLVELRRKKALPPEQAEHRLETIAVLAVRMRETVRRLSEEWETQSESAARELSHHPT